jgi:hypothetical protein
VPCLIVLVALISPRLALVLIALFDDRIVVAFDGNELLPIAGWFLLPWTTLMWVLAWAPIGGVQNIGWVFVGLGVLLDLSSLGFGRRGVARD